MLKINPTSPYAGLSREGQDMARHFESGLRRRFKETRRHPQRSFSDYLMEAIERQQEKREQSAKGNS